MAIAGKLLLDVDGAAWYSGPPDPNTYQQANATHAYIYDGSIWTEAVAVWVYDGAAWVSVAPPTNPTLAAHDDSFCLAVPGNPSYNVGVTVTDVAPGATYELRGFRSTTGDSGYTQATPSFTVTEGDGGTCWGYYQVRTKFPYSGWSAWSGDSNHVHVAFKQCGRPI